MILLIPSPPLWNGLDCRGLVPPKSGVLTLCACVCARPIRQGDHCFITAYKVCAHVCSQTAYLCRHLRFPQKTRSDGVALGYCGDYVRQQNKKKGTPAANISECVMFICTSCACTHLISVDFCPYFAKKVSLQRKNQREHGGASEGELKSNNTRSI